MRAVTLALAGLAVAAGTYFAQQVGPLSVQWEELTAPDFVRAAERSEGTCVVPLGILPSSRARQLADMIREVNADTTVLELQERFFEQAEKPLRTPQE